MFIKSTDYQIKDGLTIGMARWQILRLFTLSCGLLPILWVLARAINRPFIKSKTGKFAVAGCLLIGILAVVSPAILGWSNVHRRMGIGEPVSKFFTHLK